MLVSVCIIAHNEEAFLPHLFAQLKEQSYPHNQIELVFVDNLSTDRTKEIMVQFSEENKAEFRQIQILDSTKNLQATAWNTALVHGNGDILIRLDAHSSIPPDFVEANVRNIKEGEDVCGGGRPNLVLNKTPWSMTLLAAEASMFGGVAAKYRRVQQEKQYLSSIFHGAYRKEVFAKVGGFNEDLGRTEDNEFHYRVRKAGYNICCCPDIRSYQYIRSSFTGMIKQKYANGYWIGLTLGVCKECLSLFYFAPLVLLLAYLFCGILCTVDITFPVLLLSAVYLLFNVFLTVSAFLGGKVNILFLLLPFIYPFLHFAYGIGTLIGLLNMPFWKRKLNGSAQKRIKEVKESFKRKLAD